MMQTVAIPGKQHKLSTQGTCVWRVMMHPTALTSVVCCSLFPACACWSCSLEDLQQQFTELVKATLAAKGVTLEVSVLRTPLRCSRASGLRWWRGQHSAAGRCTRRVHGCSCANSNCSKCLVVDPQ
jgi:hypothetical protein